MQVGDQVLYCDDIDRVCVIWKINHDVNGYICYDILYPERNVPIESMTSDGKVKKGDVVTYKKHNRDYEAYVSTIDWSSSSAQIRIILRNLYYN